MMMERVLSRSLRLMFTGGAAIVGLGLFAQAQAQQVVNDVPMQRVEVTGSAIKRIDAETAVPVTVLKMDDLKKEGFTTIEQVMSNLSASQSAQGTSQSVGSGTGGASFADLRGIGANKTLVLLNGRRLANNAYDSSAPDLNMIPFAALERVEVLRDGASALYGSDAVGGVINFITKKDYQGGTFTAGADSPQHPGGAANNFNLGYGFGDLEEKGYNVFAMVDHQEQHRIGGTQRPYNTRYAGGLSSSTFPANYFQGGDSFNPTAPSCASGSHLISDGASGCEMTTSSFVDYVPKSERTTGLIKGTIKLNADNELGLEYLNSKSKVSTMIAPVPYGGLFQNRLRPDGSVNPYYPTNAALDPNYTEANMAAGVNPGFVNVKWRDLPNGARQDESVNKQQRFVASLTGNVAGWDYDGALTYNENKVTDNIFGYSDGGIISQGVLDGVINPYGAQDAAGTALLNSAAIGGRLQSAKGTNKGADFHASREVGDWFNAGHKAALAVGTQLEHQHFDSEANFPIANAVVASTGLDPTLHNEGSRNVYALYAELDVPVTKQLDVTVAARSDKYSDFGTSTNPKASFRYQPSKAVLLRGSYSTGFRAPSLYELHASPSYTNTADEVNDPVNCPGGTPIPGKSSAANCSQQFQQLNGGNPNLKPEKSKNASLGLVVEPIANLSMSLDFWSIRLRNTIGSLQDTDVIADPALFASVYHRNPAGNLSVDGSQCPNPTTCGYLDLTTINLGDTNTNGLDIGTNYKWRTSGFGNYSFVTNSTYVHKYEYQNFSGDVMHSSVGQFSGTGPIFRWQSTASLNWTAGKFAAGVTGHYKSGYEDFYDGSNPQNHVSSYTTFDTYGSWNVLKTLNLTAGVRNLFDRDPPLSYQTKTFQAGYDPRYTDPTGRTFYVRGTYNF
jgi:iron complex outermembrane receptor protein